MPNFTDLGFSVEANPGGSGTQLDTVKINGTVYSVPSGTTAHSLDSITLSNTEFNVNGATETVTITGSAGNVVNLSFDMVSPAGWITTGALSATQVTIPSSGSTTVTMTFPTTEMTVNRTARLVATDTTTEANTVNTGLFRQIIGHGTGSGGDGDLTASFELDITGFTVSTSTTIIGGDAPYTVELFDTDPRSGSPTAVQSTTINTAASRTSPQTHNFTDIDTSTFSNGSYTYFLRITDSESGSDDVLIESESFSIDRPTFTLYNGDGGTIYMGDDHGGFYMSIVGVDASDSAGDYRLDVDGGTSGGGGSVSSGYSSVTDTIRFGVSSLDSLSDGTHTYTVYDTTVSPASAIASGNFTVGDGFKAVEIVAPNHIHTGGFYRGNILEVELYLLNTSHENNTVDFGDITVTVYSDAGLTTSVVSRTVSYSSAGTGSYDHQITTRALTTGTTYWLKATGPNLDSTAAAYEFTIE